MMILVVSFLFYESLKCTLSLDAITLQFWHYKKPTKNPNFQSLSQFSRFVFFFAGLEKRSIFTMPHLTPHHIRSGKRWPTRHFCIPCKFSNSLQHWYNTLFEFFIFCPKNQLWFPENNCQIVLGEKLVKMLRFWTF